MIDDVLDWIAVYVDDGPRAGDPAALFRSATAIAYLRSAGIAAERYAPLTNDDQQAVRTSVGAVLIYDADDRLASVQLSHG